MAVEDYTGKEKVSLNNIKNMIENGASLQQIRGAMGLGYSLGVLEAANGGTGVNNLQDVANVIVEAMKNMKMSQYDSATAARAFASQQVSYENTELVFKSSAATGNLAINGNSIVVNESGLYLINGYVSITNFDQRADNYTPKFIVGESVNDAILAIRNDVNFTEVAVAFRGEFGKQLNDMSYIASGTKVKLFADPGQVNSHASMNVDASISLIKIN